MEKLNKILEVYDTLSEDEKIALYCTLSSKDMREFYNPSYKKYRLVVKNYYNQYLVDKVMQGSYYNQREALKSAYREMEASNREPYHASRERYMYGHEKKSYRMKAYRTLEVVEYNG